MSAEAPNFNSGPQPPEIPQSPEVPQPPQFSEVSLTPPVPQAPGEAPFMPAGPQGPEPPQYRGAELAPEPPQGPQPPEPPHIREAGFVPAVPHPPQPPQAPGEASFMPVPQPPQPPQVRAANPIPAVPQPPRPPQPSQAPKPPRAPRAPREAGLTPYGAGIDLRLHESNLRGVNANHVPHDDVESLLDGLDRGRKLSKGSFVDDGTLDKLINAPRDKKSGKIIDDSYVGTPSTVEILGRERPIFGPKRLKMDRHGKGLRSEEPTRHGKKMARLADGAGRGQRRDNEAYKIIRTDSKGVKHKEIVSLPDLIHTLRSTLESRVDRAAIERAQQDEWRKGLPAQRAKIADKVLTPPVLAARAHSAANSGSAAAALEALDAHAAESRKMGRAAGRVALSPESGFETLAEAGKELEGEQRSAAWNTRGQARRTPRANRANGAGAQLAPGDPAAAQGVTTAEILAAQTLKATQDIANLLRNNRTVDPTDPTTVNFADKSRPVDTEPEQPMGPAYVSLLEDMRDRLRDGETSAKPLLNLLPFDDEGLKTLLKEELKREKIIDDQDNIIATDEAIRAVQDIEFGLAIEDSMTDGTSLKGIRYTAASGELVEVVKQSTSASGAINYMVKRTAQDTNGKANIKITEESGQKLIEELNKNRAV